MVLSIVQVSGNHCIGQTLFPHTIFYFFFFSNPPQISAPSLTFCFSLSPPLSFLFCSCFFLCCCVVFVIFILNLQKPTSQIYNAHTDV